MCGIVGFRQSNGRSILPRHFARMVDSLSHRGPDGSGAFLWDGSNMPIGSADAPATVGLGHRRLSILDLSTRGAQPMVSPDGNVVLTYNGELYNFASLKEELERGGRRFASTSDTEVVLAAYERWGIECLPKLIGMFAFAIYDRTSGDLILARDRLGIK